MIIVDLNQVMFSTFQLSFMDLKKELNEDIIRHIVLNTIRSYNMKWKQEFGEMILASDSRIYWRRKVFPQYKALRKLGRDASGLPWDLIFKSMDKIKKELKENFPYRMIEVDGAEADDIIATLSFNFPDEKTIILSSDKDFVQLHSDTIQQFDPVRKKRVSSINPASYLEEHVLKGDKGDGVPNIYTKDDAFVKNERQTPLTTSRIADFKNGTISKEVERNYFRNKTLIDLKCIPDDITKSIMIEYELQSGKNKSKIFNYLFTNKLSNLMEKINDF